MDSATYYNEVVSNFDLNQFGNASNVQVPQPNYEKLRKTAHWLKTKILTSDFVVQRYLAQVEDYNQALKAHSLTKEDLKRTCINYKDVSEKCLKLENEVKASVAKQEMLQNKANDVQNKYDAMVSFSNQMQLLVKELETQKEALILEKKIDNTHEKLMLLQKEKVTMIKDIMALASVVLGKEKKTRRHTNLIKSYIKMNDTNISDEDESADEIPEKPTSKSKKKLKKMKKSDDQDIISSLDRNFIDYDSDASNGRDSIDTGRGSSRANSHKNDLNSPEYYSFESSQKISLQKEMQLIDVANSPIRLQQSASTSPIHFENINHKDLDNNEHNFDNNDFAMNTYNIENHENNFVGSAFSNDISESSQERIFEEASSPILLSNNRKYVDVCTSPINNKDINFEEDSELDIEKTKCLCQKSDFKEKPIHVDVCTSPILDIVNSNEVSFDTVDDTSLSEVSIISGTRSLTISKHKQEQKSYCDKYTITDFVHNSPALRQPETEHSNLSQSSFVNVCDKAIDTDPPNVCASPILLHSETQQLQSVEPSSCINIDITLQAEIPDPSPILEQPEPQQFEPIQKSSFQNFHTKSPVLHDLTQELNLVKSNSVHNFETSLDIGTQHPVQHTLLIDQEVDPNSNITENSMSECVRNEIIHSETQQLQSVEPSSCINIDSTLQAEIPDPSPILEQPEPQQFEPIQKSSFQNFHTKSPVLHDLTQELNLVKSNSVHNFETSLDIGTQHPVQHTLLIDQEVDPNSNITENSMSECVRNEIIHSETQQLQSVEPSSCINIDSTLQAEIPDPSPILEQPEPQQFEPIQKSSFQNFHTKSPVLHDLTQELNLVKSNSVHNFETSLDIGTQHPVQHTLLIDQEVDPNSNITENSMSVCVRNEIILGGKEKEIPEEKICLENHNSKNLGYEHSNDPEIQVILSEMKIGHLISPLPKSPATTITTPLLDGVMNVLSLLCGHATKSRNQNEKNKPIRDFQQNLNVKDRLSRKRNYEEMLHDMINSLKDLSETCPEEENIESVEGAEQNAILSTNEQINEEEEVTTNIISSDVLVECEVNNTSDEYLYQNKSNNVSSNDLNVIELPEMVINDSPKSDKIEQVAVKKDLISNKFLSNPHKRQANICETTSNIGYEKEINNSDTYNVTEIRSCDIPIKKKINKKSKLEKLRNALLPNSKIKKMSPATVARSSKFCRVTSTQITSSELKNKIAYENAVKIMTELKLKKATGGESKDKERHEQKPEEAPSVRKLDEMKSPSIDSNVISTISQTLSKKENDVTVIVSPSELLLFEDNAGDIEKSPTTRKGRKRLADTELNNSQVSKKRTLRSSNDQSIHNVYLPKIENVSDGELQKQRKNMSTLLSDQSDIDQLNINNNIKKQSKSLITEQNEHGKSVETSTGNKDTTKNWGEHFILPDTDDNLVLADELDERDTSLDATNPSNEIENHQDDLILNEIGAEPICTDTVIHNVKVVELENQSIQELVIMKDGDKNNDDNDKDPSINSQPDTRKNEFNKSIRSPVVEVIPLKNEIMNHYLKNIVSYSDVQIYKTDLNQDDIDQKTAPIESQCLKDNILLSAIDRYGVNSVKYTAKKIPEVVRNTISKIIENSITEIIAAPMHSQKNEMIKLVDGIKVYKTKHILSGLIKYLIDPTRKCELFNKIVNGPAPPMTKSEAILLYVIENLNITDSVYKNIEHSLFQLNKAPHFDVIESMSHFYAVMCTYFRNKSKLRCFMLDAMYCLQFKAVPLIKQCLDVCPRVLPMAHEHMAKTSLVTCLVYLLHFYKCKDRLNRAQAIRDVLNVKYKYRFSEWNESMILEIFRKAIMNLKGMHNDKNMLRLALIILCKRHGPKWCETKIINNMLIPVIQQPDTPEKIKQFCVLMLGPLLKPFPPDKKAQCEIVINQLLLLLKQNPSHDMKEAIYSSLIFMDKHDKERVIQALLSWNPKKVSPDFEDLLNSYVMEKPLGMWKKLVAQTSQCS